ncbi:MAG: Hpt domain-containing protein, partial [Gemmatimonadota bacterium]
MQVRVVADADWMPELEAHLPGDAARVDASALDGSEAALVVPMASADRVLEAFDGAVPVPVAWIVPKTATRPQLERLSGAAAASRFVFEPVLPAVVEAVRTLLRAAAAAGAEGARRRAASSMGELWEQFQGTMVERLEVLEAVGAGLLEGDVDGEALADARTAAHKLHGSLGTFGLHRGSELAAELETLVESGLESGSLDAGDRYRYSELVVGLRRQIEAGRPGDSEERAAAWPDASGTVLLVDSDPDRLEKLGAAAGARGWRPARATSAASALEELRSGARPAMAILDPGAGELD